MSIESKKDFEQTPQGRYKYWQVELDASIKAREPWWRRADKIVNRYVGKMEKDNRDGFDLNLFHSNTKTLGDMLYGNTPKIDVSRRYAQADDDVGRVAAEMMERLLNLDVASNGADVDAVFRATLQDRLLSGLGCAKVRYSFDTDTDEMGEQRVVNEEAPIDYFYWGDILWGWCRNWADMPWIAFRSYMTKDEIAERWGEDVANDVPLKKQTKKTSDEGAEDETNDSTWQRAEVWEIWNKSSRKVCWMVLGHDKILEEKEDHLKLSGFWPVPPFFIANVTTSLYTPTPDFQLAQDLYNEIDVLQTRIHTITTAVRVVGVYNASADNIKGMLQQGMDNKLVPVENWALFGENGGIAGQIEWLPLADIANALQQLVGLRDQTIALLQQVTGMTDVMRGALDNQYEGVGQTDAKTKFGSVRIQALQDQFARFASDLMQIKAEVISRHFSPETIFKRSNMRYSKDEDYIQSAIELIKTPDEAKLRVEIRPESVAMVDYQALKGERTEYLNALSTFMQSAAPLMDADPSAKPFLLQMLQWGLAGFKGASEIEGVMDKAIEASQKEAEQPQQQPDPAQMAAQMAQQLEQMKQQGEMQKIQAKSQADMQMRQADQQADITTAYETHRMKIAEINAAMQAKVAETQTSLQADLLMEQAQAQSNIMQTQATAEGEMQKDLFEHEINMVEEQGKTQAKMQEILASAEADIQKQTVAAALTPEPQDNDED